MSIRGGQAGQRQRRRTSWLAALAAIAMLVVTGCDENLGWGWGFNISGQLGDGTFTTTSTPVSVSTTGVLANKGLIDISAGYFHTCALAIDGTVACWGSNTFGALGAPVPMSTNVPVAVVLPPAVQGKRITQVSAGNNSTCVLASDGTVACWGLLGPSQIVGPLAGSPVVEVSVGWAHACVRTALGAIACWGNNNHGQLGNGTFAASPTPVFVMLTPAIAGKQILGITAGDYHTCAVASDGTAACWGSNEEGELGNNSTTTSNVPVSVSATGALAGKRIVQISGGQKFTCAKTADGIATCWGWNDRGQLGNPAAGGGSLTAFAVDTSGVLAGKRIEQVSAGHWHGCAVATDGTAACWGFTDNGQLGDGVDLSLLPPNAVKFSPVPVVDSGDPPVLSIDAGGFHTAAIRSSLRPSLYAAINPVRVLDTRQSTPYRPAGPMAQGERVMVELAQFIPYGTTGVSYNVTATGQTASGFASVVPALGTAPGTSTVNWMGPQQTIANGHISKILGEDRILYIEVASTGTSHIVLDITGYFTPVPSGGISSGTDVFKGAERRIYNFGAPGGAPIPPGGTLKVNVNTGAPPPAVPITAAAVNVTVTGTTGSGVLTVAKDKSTTTSTINWSGPNQTIANAVITGVAPDDTFTITNNGSTPARVIVDLTGTFSPVASGATGARYWPLEPNRTYDSRVADGVLAGGQSRITSHPVPVDATAIVVNTTVTGTTGTGYLSLGQPMVGPPATSTVNWYNSPTTRANGSIITTNGHATRAFVGGSYATHYTIDVGGYFR